MPLSVVFITTFLSSATLAGTAPAGPPCHSDSAEALAAGRGSDAPERVVYHAGEQSASA